jgi:homoserine dehydrogenase
VRKLRIGLLGCGTVGGGLVGLVARERDRVRARFGVELQIERILVRDRSKPRPGVDRRLLTTNALDVLDGDCDLVVEAVGGVHAAGSYVRRAIARGHHVVTANKALLAASGGELFAAAARKGVTIGFEASVCGGVPVIGALRRGLAGDTIVGLRGILNGTSNYVLCRMDEGMELAEAVKLAQASGFAEADPSLDLGGQDAMQKLRILAALAFEEPVRKMTVVGIPYGGRPGRWPAGVTPDGKAERTAAQDAPDVLIRQVAEARRVPGGIELTVEPRLLPLTDPLARVVDEQNAVVIRGRAVGDIWLSGRGAGSLPTAVAVLSDILNLT